MSSVNVNASDIINTLGLLAGVVGHAQEAYAAHRALAEKAGISKEDLDAADARFVKVYSDPLKEKL